MSAAPSSPAIEQCCPSCDKPFRRDARFCNGCGFALGAVATTLAKPLDASNSQYAVFWQRLAAHVIDQAAIAVSAYVFGRPLGAMMAGALYAAGLEPDWDMMSYLGAFLLAVFTSFVFEVVWIGSHLQATPGKCALRLKVTDVWGKPLGFIHAFGRYMLKGLSSAAFCLGFLIQPLTPKKQALHDMLAGTLVLRR